jgi:hypothetical protein
MEDIRVNKESLKKLMSESGILSKLGLSSTDIVPEDQIAPEKVNSYGEEIRELKRTPSTRDIDYFDKYDKEMSEKAMQKYRGRPKLSESFGIDPEHPPITQNEINKDIKISDAWPKVELEGNPKKVPFEPAKIGMREDIGLPPRFNIPKSTEGLDLTKMNIRKTPDMGKSAIAEMVAARALSLGSKAIPITGAVLAGLAPVTADEGGDKPVGPQLTEEQIMELYKKQQK